MFCVYFIGIACYRIAQFMKCIKIYSVPFCLFINLWFSFFHSIQIVLLIELIRLNYQIVEILQSNLIHAETCQPQIK